MLHVVSFLPIYMYAILCTFFTGTFLPVPFLLYLFTWLFYLDPLIWSMFLCLRGPILSWLGGTDIVLHGGHGVGDSRLHTTTFGKKYCCSPPWKSPIFLGKRSFFQKAILTAQWRRKKVFAGREGDRHTPVTSKIFLTLLRCQGWTHIVSIFIFLP
jgi:hypothetical protein